MIITIRCTEKEKESYLNNAVYKDDEFIKYYGNNACCFDSNDTEDKERFDLIKGWIESSINWEIVNNDEGDHSYEKKK